MLTQSEAESKFISSAYGIDSSKIHAIPNGVSLSKFVIGEELIRNHLKCYSDFVLSVGRFDENKNQLSIIRALKNKPIPIVFIGGPDPFSLEYYERCKEEATDNMYFLGWLSHDDPLLVSAYVAAKVVVLASYKETFGNVILEGGLYGSNLAISKGIPILDYNNLRKECFTFNPNDIMDIEIQIELAYNSPVNSSIKKIIADNFTWDAVAKTHISIYESLLSH